MPTTPFHLDFKRREELVAVVSEFLGEITADQRLKLFRYAHGYMAGTYPGVQRTEAREEWLRIQGAAESFLSSLERPFFDKQAGIIAEWRRPTHGSLADEHADTLRYGQFEDVKKVVREFLQSAKGKAEWWEHYTGPGAGGGPREHKLTHLVWCLKGLYEETGKKAPKTDYGEFVDLVEKVLLVIEERPPTNEELGQKVKRALMRKP